MNTREREPRGQAVTQSAAADWRDPESFRASDQSLDANFDDFTYSLSLEAKP
jgi:hypothetical protein